MTQNDMAIFNVLGESPFIFHSTNIYKFLLCAKCGSRYNLDAITTSYNHLCSLTIMQPAMVTWYMPQTEE